VTSEQIAFISHVDGEVPDRAAMPFDNTRERIVVMNHSEPAPRLAAAPS